MTGCINAKKKLRRGERETKWVRLEKGVRECDVGEQEEWGKGPNTERERERSREMKRAGVLFIHLPLP